MLVQIEDGRVFQHQAGQARLFLGFLQRHPGQVAVAVGVAAQLQPALQLAVVGQQQALAVGTDQPAAGGEVPGQPFAPERILRIVQQCAEFGSQCVVGGLAAGVVPQQAAQAIVKHGKGFGGLAHEWAAFEKILLIIAVHCCDCACALASALAKVQRAVRAAFTIPGLPATYRRPTQSDH